MLRNLTGRAGQAGLTLVKYARAVTLSVSRGAAGFKGHFLCLPFPDESVNGKSAEGGVKHVYVRKLSDELCLGTFVQNVHNEALRAAICYWLSVIRNKELVRLKSFWSRITAIPLSLLIYRKYIYE